MASRTVLVVPAFIFSFAIIDSALDLRGPSELVGGVITFLLVSFVVWIPGRVRELAPTSIPSGTTGGKESSEITAKSELSDSVKKMFLVANELGEKAVDRYRLDVAALGYTPEIEGELCARILGEATAAVVHNSEFGLNDWCRAAPSIVGHAIVAILNPDRANPRMPPAHFYGYGMHVMELVEKADAGGLSHAYQSALANSCGGAAFLERAQSREELKGRFIQMSASFAADLLSIWVISAHMRIHGRDPAGALERARAAAKRR